MRFTKMALVKKVADRGGYHYKDVRNIFTCLEDIMEEEILNGNEVGFLGIGTFLARCFKDVPIRHPVTQEVLRIGDRWTIRANCSMRLARKMEKKQKILEKMNKIE